MKAAANAAISERAGDLIMLKELTAAVIAASTAIIPFSTDSGNVFSPINIYAEETGAIATLPDWIPSDFDSAVNFRNIYGAVHIDNGLICIVYPELVRKGSKEGTYGYDLKPSSDIGEKLKHEIYSNDHTETCFNVFVYQPHQQGDIELKIVDTHAMSDEGDKPVEPPIISIYSFSVDKILNINETDIFSWLPDSKTEYNEYIMKNDEVSVKDNYVVFCTTTIGQFGDKWEPDSTNKYENIRYLLSSDCTMQVPDLYDDGSIDKIYVYQAVQDGSEQISWTRTYDISPNPDELKTFTLTADCAVINNAQNILLSGDMRVTLVDSETDELLTITDGAIPRIWTDISKNTPEGRIYCNMQPVGFNSNPAIVSLGNFFDGYDFSFGLGPDDLPVGYSLPDTEDGKSGYYNGTTTPDDHITVTRFDNGSADVVFKLKKDNAISNKSTKITFYDTDTGELIDIPEGNTYIMKSTSKAPYTSEIFDITSNPCTIASDHLYENSCYYSFNSYTRSGYYSYLKFEITSDNQDCIELTCRMKWRPSGDFNGDNNFSISDVIFMQKWLLGAPCTETADFKAADFCRDNVIDVFDLAIMRRELIDSGSLYVEPDVKVGYSPITVLKNGLKLYIGPDESYGYIEYISIPEGTKLNEDGYQNGNDNWVFVCYNFRYGWIKTVKDDNKTPTIRHEVIVAKPVIHLYPEEETDVHVELELTEAELSTTYPKYNNGWDVTASPDGSLLNKADGSHHKYLFWDAVNCRTRFDFSKGFCVAGSDTEYFLKEQLTYMGLTEEEMNEFIVYWLPLMEHNKYNLISFQGDAYTKSAKLNITPTPDSLLRIFMTYVPLEEAVDIQPQQLETFERNGFTVVEWGGSEIKS